MLSESSEIIPYLTQIPEIDRFPSIDELNNLLCQTVLEFPSLCKWSEIGISRRGQTLHLLSIGHGSKQILVTAGAHPNEPIGFLSTIYLARMVAANPEFRDESDYTWNFIPCLDPDGARLNEGWYREELTLNSYYAHYFRPDMSQQPELTFPYSVDALENYELLSETKALVRVVDLLRPCMYWTLHNTDFCGAYVTVSHEIPELSAMLDRVAASQGIPWGSDCMDTVGSPRSGPGLFINPGIQDKSFADFEKTREMSDFPGFPHMHYASQYGTLSLVSEVGLWNVSPDYSYFNMHNSYDDNLATLHIDLQRQVCELSNSMERVESVIQKEEILFRSAARSAIASLDGLANSIQSYLIDDKSRNILRFDLASLRMDTLHLPLRVLSLLIRLVREEYDSSKDSQTIGTLLTNLTDQLTLGSQSLEKIVEPFPLRSLVAVQVGSVLSGLLCIRN